MFNTYDRILQRKMDSAKQIHTRLQVTRVRQTLVDDIAWCEQLATAEVPDTVGELRERGEGARFARDAVIRSYDALQRVLPEDATDRDVLKDRFRQALREALGAYDAVGNQLRAMGEEGLDPWEECRVNEGADATDNQPEVMSLQEKADLLDDLIKEPTVSRALRKVQTQDKLSVRMRKLNLQHADPSEESASEAEDETDESKGYDTAGEKSQENGDSIVGSEGSFDPPRSSSPKNNRKIPKKSTNKKERKRSVSRSDRKHHSERSGHKSHRRSRSGRRSEHRDVSRNRSIKSKKRSKTDRSERKKRNKEQLEEKSKHHFRNKKRSRRHHQSSSQSSSGSENSSDEWRHTHSISSGDYSSDSTSCSSEDNKRTRRRSRSHDKERRHPFELVSTRRQEKLEKEQTYRHRLRNLCRAPEPSTLFDGDVIKFKAWANRLRAKAHSTPVTPGQAMEVLSIHSSGEVKKKVDVKLHSAGAYTPALVDTMWRELRGRYGGTAQKAQEIMDKLDHFPPIIGRDREAERMHELKDICHMILTERDTCSEIRRFDTHSSMRSTVEKLPMRFQHQWKDRMAENMHRRPSFKALVDFIGRRAETEATFSQGMSHKKIIDTKHQHNVKVLGTQVEIVDPEKFFSISDSEDSFSVLKTDLAESPPCVFCKKTGHSITRCFSFSELTLDKKRSYVQNQGLCWLCMKDGHMYRDCPVKDKIKQCSVGGCGKKHPAALFHSLRPTVAQSHQPSADVTTLPPL